MILNARKILWVYTFYLIACLFDEKLRQGLAILFFFSIRQHHKMIAKILCKKCDF